PANGTCAIWTPAMRLNISPARWLGPPTPDDANICSPGCARASAMYSASVFAGTDGCTTSTTGLRDSSDTGAKSLTGSYGRFGLAYGAMTSDASVVTSSVVPSGSAFATTPVPIRPAAPARFST